MSMGIPDGLPDISDPRKVALRDARLVTAAASVLGHGPLVALLSPGDGRRQLLLRRGHPATSVLAWEIDTGVGRPAIRPTRSR